MTATRLDWLGISFDHRRFAAHRFLQDTVGHAGAFQGEARSGVHGFEHSARFTVDGAHIGMAAWGGESQKGRSYVELSGVGCALVRDWDEALERVLALPGAILKRADIAADYYHGEVSYDDTLAAYHRGKFQRGSRPPKSTQILPGRTEDGRTLYVGTRGNDVFFRAYEKGLKEHHPQFREWVRLELELRAVKRALPFDVIPQRDQFFAGAYPFLAEQLPHVRPEILVTPQRIACSNMAEALRNIRDQYGNTINTAIAYHGGDIGAVMDEIRGTGFNQSLVDAGIFLRDTAVKVA